MQNGPHTLAWVWQLLKDFNSILTCFACFYMFFFTSIYYNWLTDLLINTSSFVYMYTLFMFELLFFSILKTMYEFKIMYTSKFKEIFINKLLYCECNRNFAILPTAVNSNETLVKKRHVWIIIIYKYILHIINK